MTTDADLIFEMLTALSRPDNTGVAVMVAQRPNDGLSLLLQILVMKVNRHRQELQQRDHSIFVTAHLQLSPDAVILEVPASLQHVLQPFGVSPVGQNFETFVSAFSKRDWAQYRNGTNQQAESTLLLLLTDSRHKVYAAACRFVATTNGGCDCTLVLMNPVTAAPEIARHYDRIFTEVLGIYYKDAELLQQVCDFLLTHLDRPKPTDKQLARQFYTNRQKLKELFRYVVGSSMYKWYMRKKLEATMALIRNTHLPLHEIAGLYGFVDFWYYSGLFEKAFGIKPSAVKRPL